MKLFVDTWGWLALEDGKDPQHESTVQCYRQSSKTKGCIVTSDFVLDETFTLLFRRRPFGEAWRFVQGVQQSAQQKFLAVEFVNEERFWRALELRLRFKDKPRISFTDLTSMAIMRELQVKEILTADAHFQQVGLGFRILPS